MKTEPLPLNDPIKVNVDGSASSFPAALSLLPPPAGIGLHIGDIEEVKGNALFLLAPFSYLPQSPKR